MTASRRVIDLLVGGFVLLGLAALMFLALKAANLGSFASGPTYEVQARFDNIGGLKPRAPVKSAGVVVGRVAAITFDDQAYQARVILNLDAGYQFPQDTSAKILTSGLLGEQYIGLEPGGDTRMLAGGGVIRMTQSAVVLENLISQFLFSKAAEPSPTAGAAPAATAPAAPGAASPAAPGAASPNASAGAKP
ncbi:MAG: outer membrane lipid asymmetry maintenance protein MlaD [Burkholderiales bacterium]|jgi:phospholipid/cholesterol/gamma-HCH transport system substrate-binding protein